MDIVLITRDRPELTEQCIRSMRENAADWSKHRLVVVFDGTGDEVRAMLGTGSAGDRKRLAIFGTESVIVTNQQLGVGGAKNFGAAHIQRQLEIFNKLAPPVELHHAENSLLMFSDNDMWYGPGWDRTFEVCIDADLAGRDSTTITQLGGWRHPFHQPTWQWKQRDPITHKPSSEGILEVDAVTGNCFVIRWSDWLKYGPFDANAIGPGQSEDFALSQRIKAGGGIVATLDPPVAIHCGLVNSSGEPATGWEAMEQQITGQLAALPEAMRDEVLIMRPVIDPAPPLRGLRVTENTLLPRGVRIGPAQVLFPGVVVASKYAPGMEQSKQEQLQRGADQLNVAAVEMGLMEPSTRAPSDAIRRIADTWSLKLNLCSGQRRFDTSKGWLNLDGQHVPPDRIPDVVWQASDPLPFEDASVQRIAIVHALEHFGCGEALPMLRECYRVLKHGGSLIAVVPDMKRLAARWLSGEINEYIFNVNCYGAYISDEMDRHRWSLSQESLPALLMEAGNWTNIDEFDYREIPGSDVPRDWWMLAMEATK